MPSDVGNFFPKLKILIISNVGSVERSRLKKMNSLEELELLNCGIKHLPYDLLYDIPDLKKIRFLFIDINKIHKDFFIYQTELEEVFIRDTHITTVEADLFKNNLKLKIFRFFLKDNPTIMVDFTRFKDLENVEISFEICFYKFDVKSGKSIQAFQQIISNNCRKCCVYADKQKYRYRLHLRWGRRGEGNGARPCPCCVLMERGIELLIQIEIADTFEAFESILK